MKNIICTWKDITLICEAMELLGYSVHSIDLPQDTFWALHRKYPNAIACEGVTLLHPKTLLLRSTNPYCRGMRIEQRKIKKFKGKGLWKRKEHDVP